MATETFLAGNVEVKPIQMKKPKSKRRMPKILLSKMWKQ